MTKLQLARIVETPDSDGGFTRTLELKDGRKLVFPKDRVIVFDGETPYDWYGREVAVDESIKRIIEPLGSYTNGDSYYEAKELYLVERNDGLMAIADARYWTREEKGRSMSRHKEVMVGRALMHHMKIIPRTNYPFKREAKELYATPVFRAYLRNMKYPKEIRVFSGVEYTLWPGDEKRFLTVFHEVVEGGSPWRFHYIAPCRDAIMSEKDSDKIKHNYANYLIGDVVVSENGPKMSAMASSRQSGLFKISTDVEVIEHLGKISGLYWYVDS